MASNRKNNYNLEWAKALDQIIADEVAEKNQREMVGMIFLR